MIKRKEYRQFTKIGSFISLHVLPYNLSRAAPPQVYGYVYSLHVQSIALGLGKSSDQTLWHKLISNLRGDQAGSSMFYQFIYPGISPGPHLLEHVGLGVHCWLL